MNDEFGRSRMTSMGTGSGLNSRPISRQNTGGKEQLLERTLSTPQRSQSGSVTNRSTPMAGGNNLLKAATSHGTF
jgi:hypothetical protein